MVKKITFLDVEGIPRDSKVLYAFTPWEKYGKKKKFVFKCGLSYGKMDNRLENYHTSFPFGVIPLQILILPHRTTKAELDKAERKMFSLLTGEDDDTDPAHRLHSITRVKRKNVDGGITEWFYGDEERLEEVFIKLHDLYEGSNLKSYDYADKIKKEYAKEKALPNTWVGEYFVNLGVKFV